MGSVGESSVEDQFNSTTLEALLSCKVRGQVQDYYKESYGVTSTRTIMMKSIGRRLLVGSVEDRFPWGQRSV